LKKNADLTKSTKSALLYACVWLKDYVAYFHPLYINMYVHTVGSCYTLNIILYTLFSHWVIFIQHKHWYWFIEFYWKVEKRKTKKNLSKILFFWWHQCWSIL